MSLSDARTSRAITLAASAARTATGTGSQVESPQPANGVAVILDVTAAATDVGDTLDVFVQALVDGTNWLDVFHFSQVLGNGGAKRYVTKNRPSAAENEFEASSALGVSSVRDLTATSWRARWDIVDSGDANQSFTFSVTLSPQ